MELLLISTRVVALAEIGDKTQLLAFVLAARFTDPGQITQAKSVSSARGNCASSYQYSSKRRLLKTQGRAIQ